MSVNTTVAKLLASLAKTDQAMRKRQWKQVEKLNNEYRDHTNPRYRKGVAKLVTEMKTVDGKSTNALKKIVKTHGWPRVSLVGKKGAYNAWLLAQHATHNLKFQKSCLVLLELAVKERQADPAQLALLKDRVLVQEGKNQVYGTQFKSNKRGEMVPFPTRDKARLDVRRAKMNLGPFADYCMKMGRPII